MPLPMVVDSWDDIPENARGAYVEVDGKIIMDTDAENVGEHPGLKPLKISQQRIRRELRDASEKLAQFGDLTPDEVKELRQKREDEEQRKAAEAGEYEKLKAKLIDQHRSQLEQIAKEKDTLLGDIQRLKVDDEILRVFAPLTHNPTLVLPHAAPFLRAKRDENGQWRTVVVDREGEARIADSAGTLMTVEQLAAEMADNPTYAPLFKGTGASGGGGQKSANTGKTGVVSITDAESFLANQKEIAAGKVRVE